MNLLLLEAGTMILVLGAFGMFLLLDRPENARTALVLACFITALLSLVMWAGIVWLVRWLLGVLR